MTILAELEATDFSKRTSKNRPSKPEFDLQNTKRWTNGKFAIAELKSETEQFDRDRKFDSAEIRGRIICDVRSNSFNDESIELF